MNTVSKGRRSEAKTKALLEEIGFEVITSVRSSYRGDNDFFNLFDHIGVATQKCWFWSELESKAPIVHFFHKGDVIFVQTKSNRKPAKAYLDKIRPHFKNSFIFIWKDRKQAPQIYQWQATEQLTTQ